MTAESLSDPDVHEVIPVAPRADSVAERSSWNGSCVGRERKRSRKGAGVSVERRSGSRLTSTKSKEEGGQIA